MAAQSAMAGVLAGGYRWQDRITAALNPGADASRRGVGYNQANQMSFINRT